ncbi:MAG: ATP-binding cassette domain-containing protein, partial [Microvirga sp.]
MTGRIVRQDEGPSPALQPILSVRALTVAFGGARPGTPAVRGVSFDVFPDEVFCIVGESGSGKSVTSLAVTGLLLDDARVEGSVRLADVDVVHADAGTLRRLRGQEVGVIFQDP